MARDGEERFATLVASMLERPGTSHGSGDANPGPQRAFGATSLKTNGKIFAMLVKGRLVVKLDRERVDALVGSGAGTNFDPGHGRLQKEWLDIDSDSDETWLELATESETFVAKRRPVT
jgi:hypothetical protein